TNNQKPINQTGLGIGYWNLGFIWSLGFGYWLLFFITLCLFASPAAQAAVGPNYIEQWGITWTFDKPITDDKSDPEVLSGNKYLYGKFVNGDYWVVGPVKIIEIFPRSITSDGTFQQDGWTVPNGITINGSMINPRANESRQGYNSNLEDFRIEYSNGLNVALGVNAQNPLTVTASSSLISTRSRSRTIDGPNTSDSDVKTASILTVLLQAPSANSFRPTYCGLTKTIYSTENLLRDMLLSLPKVTGTPAIASVEAKFQKPWLGHIAGWSGKYIFPVDSININYGAVMHDVIGIGALMLHLDFSLTEKEKLLIYYVQLGIDLYGIVADGGTRNWLNDGGHAGGRKWPILFAGIMLNNSEMKNVGMKSGDYLYSAMPNTSPVKYYEPGGGWDCPVTNGPPADYVHFGEDDQSFYVTQLDVDLTNSAYWKPGYDPNLPYVNKDIGMPEWGINHSERPHATNNLWSAGYRNIASPPFHGPALAALMMNAKEIWNHNAYFDYTDRYMAATKVGGENYGYWSNVGSFTRNMWDTYRANYGPIWPDKGVVMYGDVSGDYALSAYDAALAARIAVGLDALGDKLTIADVSGDGFITAYDAALIAQKAVGFISKFPVES
ncbi:MAG: dockerin type I repeat-containing protein, partial [Candidatus Omnitrophica bacterium]|nr:dockerin type I repeat-containing protein [Candidatus Omnitrophota bacterium]